MIAHLASRRRGLVTRSGLLDAGLTYDQIAYRTRIGHLHVVHRGVYAVGHPALAPLAPELAAVFACGDGALLSHERATVVWEMLPPRDGAIDITLTRGRRRPRPGIRLHRATGLEGTLRHGIPITTPERTLLDLAGTDPGSLPRAFAEAQARGLVDPARMTIPAGRRGAAALRALLAEDPALTRSEAERLLLALLRRAGLPRPRTNVRVGRFEVDALWPDRRLVIEVDGYRFHGTRAAFERDRSRDAELQAAGYRVLRVTWRQLRHEPEAVVARIAAALAVG